MRPGIQSSEFWAVIAAKVVSMLVVFGIISASQQNEWQTAVGNALLGCVAIWQMVAMVREYVSARSNQKQQLLDALTGKDDPPSGGTTGLKIGMFFLAAAGLCAVPTWASAQAQVQAPVPARAGRESVTTLPYRRQMEQRMQNVERNGRQQQAPQAAPQTDPALAASIQLLGQQLAQLQQAVQAMQQRNAAPAPASPSPAAPQTAPQIYYMLPPSASPGQPQMAQPQQTLPINPPQYMLPIQAPQYVLPIQAPQQQMPIAPQQYIIPIQPPQYQIAPAPAPAAPKAAPQMLLPMPAPAAPAQPAPSPLVPAPLIGPPQQQLPAPAPSGYQRYATWRPPPAR